MAIAFVAAGTVASGTNPTVAVPAGYAAGDLLVLFLGCSNVSPATPAGWTLQASYTSAPRLYVYYKFASASESSVTVSVASAQANAVMLAYRGASGIEAASAGNLVVGTSTTSTSLTTTRPNDYVVSFYSSNQVGTFTEPASTNSRVNLGSPINGILIVDELQASAGASTTRTATFSVSGSLTSIAFAITPATTYYWVGGAGTWNTTLTTNWATSSGGAGGAGYPLPGDNVIIDTASGTGSISGTSGNLWCNNLTVTASQAITITNVGSIFYVYGSVSLPAGGSFTISSTAGITFAATTTGKTITTNGKSIGYAIFNGVGGEWTLQDSFTTSGGDIALTNGSLNTNNQTVTIAGNFSYSASGTATLTLGSSTVTLSGAWSFATTTGLTFNANTSQITLTGTVSGSTYGAFGGLTYNNVSFTGVSSTNATYNITGANTFNNLSFSAPSGVGYISHTFSANQIINGTLTVGGATPTNRIWLKSVIVGTPYTLTAAAVSLTNVDFTDITGAGTATWSGTNLGNATGNSGITFPASKTVYWNLAGAQNWSATGWATTPTGTPATANFPLPQDTATFTNSGSVTGIITINTGWNIGTLDMSGRTTAMTLATGTTTPTIYSNWLNGTGTTLTGTGALTFAGRTTQTITSNGVTFTQPIIINSPGGTVQLADDITLTATAPSLTVTNGSFNSNSKNMQIIGFAYSGTGTSPSINISNSTITLTNSAGTYWNFATTTGLGSLITTGSTIVMTGTLVGTRVFAGGGLTYNNLVIGGTSPAGAVYSITGANTFTGTVLSTRPVAFTLQFAANQTIANWGVTGSAGNIVTLSSSVAGTARTLTLT
ncbi:MAG: hypothetical protein WCP55_06820, partial [Lentisphaerota bacterium]